MMFENWLRKERIIVKKLFEKEYPKETNMDALKFIEERNRMCDYYRGDNALSGCAECPVFEIMCSSVKYVTSEYIAAVEQWSKEHPRKTRQRKFLDMFPTASVDDVGVLNVCPAAVDDRYRDGHCGSKTLLSCQDCSRKFWMQEVE